MIRYPTLSALPTSTKTINVFRGLNRTQAIQEGELQGMENLSGDSYPAISPRKKRSLVTSGDDINALIRTSSGVFYTDYGDIVTPTERLRNVYQPQEQYKQEFVQMGQYLLLVPEMVWIKLYKANSADAYEYGNVNVSCSLTGTVTFQMCREDGTVYEDVAESDTEPENPSNAAYWLDTATTPNSLKQYSAARGEWVSVASTFIRITTDETIGGQFQKYDGVEISGVVDERLESLNASTVIWNILQGDNHEVHIIVPGILNEKITQECEAEGTMRIERAAPKMDYVVEAGNRLWGCRYGLNNSGEFVNEIYASRLGDFKNWSCFMGVATDSWAASVGSPGRFTGAANVGGYPVFYKENMKHKVWISESGAHQITNTSCHGVMTGCDRSIATMNGAVVYRARNRFCLDDGGLPEEFGQELGDGVMHYAVGCVVGSKYYVSDGDAEELLVYDFEKKLWHREDGLYVKNMSSDGVSCLLAVTDNNQIIDLMGGYGTLDAGAVKWMAQTGDLGLDSPERKYISRLTLRLSMEQESMLTVYAQYDNEPHWIPLGSVRGRGLQSFLLPLRPRRCDHLKLKFEGKGKAQIYSITKTIEEGSDIP